MSPDQFAEKIKAKYPQYKDVDNLELTQKIINKYPQYESQVQMPQQPSERSIDFQETKGAISSSFQEGVSEFGTGGRIDQRVQSGEISKTKGVFQRAGGALGKAFQIGFEGAVGAGKMLLPQSVEDKVAETAKATGEQVKAYTSEFMDELRSGDMPEQEVARQIDEVVTLYQTDETFRDDVNAAGGFIEALGSSRLAKPILDGISSPLGKVREIRTPEFNIPYFRQSERAIAEGIENTKRFNTGSPVSIPVKNADPQTINNFTTQLTNQIKVNVPPAKQQEIIDRLDTLIKQGEFQKAAEVANVKTRTSLSGQVVEGALDTAVLGAQKTAQLYRDLVEGATNRTIKILDRRALTDNAGLPVEKVDSNIADMYVNAVSPGVKGKKTSVDSIATNKQSAVSAVKNITENQANLKFRDIETNEIIEGALPSNLWEFGGAITHQKSQVYKQVLEKLGAAADEPVDSSRIVEAMTEIIENPVYANEKAIVNRAQQQLNKFFSTDYTPSQIEELIQLENDRLQAFYRGSGSQADAIVSAIVANNLRDMLDEAVESATGTGVSQLKKQYGDLKAIERDVVHRALHNSQAREAGLVDMFGIRTIGDVALGASGDLGALRRGAGQIAGEGFIKALNDRDALINRMFMVADQAYSNQSPALGTQ